MIITSCGRSPNVAKLASAEAIEATMLSANDAQRKGDYARAHDLFEAVTIAQPANALAHLQTAILKQDRMNDDAGALFHLRAFIRLEPGSDKAAMAAERLELARQRLGQHSVTTERPAASHANPGAEYAAATNALARANAEIAGLLARMQKLDDDNARLQNEINRLTKYIELSSGASTPVPPSGLDEFRAQHGLGTPQPKPPSQIPKPPRYRTVEVRRGDTLWSIAQDYLYDGSRVPEIRAANPGLIGADGVLKPGTVINLPIN